MIREYSWLLDPFSAACLSSTFSLSCSLALSLSCSLTPLPSKQVRFHPKGYGVVSLGADLTLVAVSCPRMRVCLVVSLRMPWHTQAQTESLSVTACEWVSQGPVSTVRPAHLWLSMSHMNSVAGRPVRRTRHRLPGIQSEDGAGGRRRSTLSPQPAAGCAAAASRGNLLHVGHVLWIDRIDTDNRHRSDVNADGSSLVFVATADDRRVYRCSCPWGLLDETNPTAEVSPILNALEVCCCASHVWFASHSRCCSVSTIGHCNICNCCRSRSEGRNRVLYWSRAAGMVC